MAQDGSSIEIPYMKFSFAEYSLAGAPLVSPELLAALQHFIFCAPLFNLVDGLPATLAVTDHKSFGGRCALP